MLPCQRVYPIDRTICDVFYPVTSYTVAYCHLTKKIALIKLIARLKLKTIFVSRYLVNVFFFSSPSHRSEIIKRTSSSLVMNLINKLKNLKKKNVNC